jgi:hypothetical protein
MSALDFLQAEITIIVREAESLGWRLDPGPGDRFLPPDVMTPGLMHARLTKLVDEYEREGSLSVEELLHVRKVLDEAIERARREIESRLPR